MHFSVRSFYIISIMEEELIGNCLVAQSGGPTAVINASVAGVVSEALNHLVLRRSTEA